MIHLLGSSYSARIFLLPCKQPLRSVPGASIGYQKHMLSLKVMMSQSEQAQWSFSGVLGGTEVFCYENNKLYELFKQNKAFPTFVRRESQQCFTIISLYL